MLLVSPYLMMLLGKNYDNTF